MSDGPPFSNTGVDFAGPLYVREEGTADQQIKVYVCLYTFASTRAVHLGSCLLQHFCNVFKNSVLVEESQRL